jgi:enolase-phosphatase E1
MNQATARPLVYLLDVEGTIAPLSLVTEQLFPYARAHFESFLVESIGLLDQHGELASDVLPEGSVLYDLALLASENRAESDPDAPRIFSDSGDHSGSRSGWIQASMSSSSAIPKFLAYIHWLMDRDRKSTALKGLQGRIWKSGFESGELKGTLFSDVPPALERWSSHGRVAIYSSGSVQAQKLLFRYSTFGDLSAFVSDYFDTKTGPKTSAESYAAIAAALKVAPGEACFFSDVVRELDPAREAGMDTRLVVRAGNAPVDDAHEHISISEFDTIE